MNMLLFGAGALTWTLTEYTLHRSVGHTPRYKNPFTREHIRHHAKANYFASSMKKAKIAAAAFAGMVALLTPIFGPVGAASFATGFLSAYALYEVLHRSLHTSPPINEYGRFLRRHHFHHHFENPKSNHGVSSPIWDILFGTFERSSKIRVPEKLKPLWLHPDTAPREYEIVC